MAPQSWVPQVRIFGPGMQSESNRGCPTLAAFLSLRLGWETSNLDWHSHDVITVCVRELVTEETVLKLCYTAILLPLIGFASLGGAQEPSPETVVRELYRQVVARHPLGIPHGEDKTVIWPLLSSGLTHKLEIAEACERDYFEQQKGREGVYKPEFGWLEDGIFSGSNEMAGPTGADVESTDSQKDGSFLVYVRLAYKDPYQPNSTIVYHWRVTAIVISEEGRFVVDDVLFFKEGSTDIAGRLSRSFSGCDGSHWTGEREHSK